MRRLFFVLMLLAGAAFAEKPNILFIAVDDLKPMLGCYGDEEIHTPHLDQLAERGTVFFTTRASSCARHRGRA